MNFTILKKVSWMAVLFFSVSIHAQTNCISGCNENTFVNTSDPNTIEYDNIISVFHSSIIKEVDGNFKVWGQGIAPDRTHVYSPIQLLPSNGYNYDGDRKSTRLNSSHVAISYAVFCLKKKNTQNTI